MITWIDRPIVGGYVRMHFQRWGEKATKSGTYLGVFANEENGTPYHYFINGEIDGIAQACFGFRAAVGTKITDTRTPTEAITEALKDPGALWGPPHCISCDLMLTQHEQDLPRNNGDFDEICVSCLTKNTCTSTTEAA